MLKRNLVMLAILCILPTVIKADSWKIFESNFTYLNNYFSLENRLPKDRSILKAFRVADGKTIAVMSTGLPLIINRNGGFSNENNADFEALQYVPSILSSVEADANDKYYFQNTSIIAYYDTETKKWLGVNVRSGKTTGTIPSLQLDNVFGMTFNKDNNLFITGSKAGKPVIAILENSEWKITPVTNDKLFPADSSKDGAIADDALNIVKRENGFRDSYIMTSPVLSGDGSIWMALGCNMSQGLVRFDNGNLNYFECKPLCGLIKDYRGNVLYATNEGISIIKPNTVTSAFLIKEKATAIFADKEALWYAFPVISEGMSPLVKYTYLKRYDFATQKTMSYTSDNTSFSNAIHKISGDANGNAVFQLNAALYILDKTELTKYPEKWIQYSSGYLNNEDFLKLDIISINKNGKYPTSVSCDEFNNRLVGIYENGKWNYYKMAVDVEAGKGFGLKGTYPNCVCYTSKGILIGTYNDGVMLFDPSSEKAVNSVGYDQKNFGKNVKDIKEDKDGNIWIGTNKGLIKYDGVTFTSFDKKNSEFKSDKVNCLHITPNNVLWVGTSGDGIYSFDGTNWTGYTKKQGLKGENIGSLSSVGETIYASNLNLFKISNTLSTIENGKVTNEELPFYIFKNSLDADEKGNLWIIGEKRGVICRKSDGSTQTYDADNSPLGYKGDGASVYRMSGYVFDGKLYVISSYDPLNNVKDNEYKRPQGGDPLAKSPLEQMAEKYRKKVNTFDGTLVSIMEIK